MASIASKLSFKLPSKKFMAFVGTCTALAGLISRDNMLSKESLHKVQSKVAHLALEPMDSHELPRKVTVYLTPPIGDGIYKTRAHFKEYVKPVLVAAAVDYEVVEGFKQGELQSKVREAIINRRKAERNVSQSTDDSNNPIQETKKKSLAETGGAIVVGRAAWVEYLHGLNEGCNAPLVDEQISTSAESETNTQSADESNKNTETKTSTTLQQSSDGIPSGTEDEILIPELEPVGYVHFYNRIGWENVPLRIYHALNSYKNYELAGEETVKVALGGTRKFTDIDLDNGKSEEKFFKGEVENPKLDEKIAERLSVYA